MKKIPTKQLVTKVMTSSLVLAAANAVYGQEAETAAAPVPAPEHSALKQFFTADVPDWIGRGKFNLNARLRYEYADTSTTEASHAPTLRTRFGYTTGDFHGFKAMIEGENVTHLASENSAQYPGDPPNGKTVVADPATTEINQYWLSYSNWDTMIKGPRQRIILDNARFVGNVGWRQNEQTFDGVYLSNNSLEDFTFQYAYLYQINRIFGTENTSIGGRWYSDSHIFNAKYNGVSWANVVGYAYLLDFSNAAPNSTATFGGYVSGTAPITDDVALNYRAEFAYQTDYGNSPLDYSTPYYHGYLDTKLFNRYTIGIGYEGLTSDNDQGFRTPLATLHAFNGWADVFLNTPAQGLRDMYATVGVTIPGDIPFKFIYHKFDSDKMSIDYGQEFDAVISKKLSENWNALIKYAYFDSSSTLYPDVQKFWAQIEFNY